MLADAEPRAAAAPALRVAGGGARVVLLLALALALTLAAALAAANFARSRAAAELGQRAAAALPLVESALSSLIEKERLVPLVLARDPEVMALLAAPEPASERRLDAKLADIAAGAGAAVIYLVDRNGVAVAASNAGATDSFVGSDYGFRTYFTEAMAKGAAMQYALGTVSGRPGLYLSRRVDSVLGPLGVIVVKVELDALETSWRDGGIVVTASDTKGTVLATTEPGWRFRSLPGRGTAREAPIAPAEDGLVRITRDGGSGLFAAASAPVGPSAPGWTLSLFIPAGTLPTDASRYAALTVFLAGLLLTAAAAWLLRRRRWAAALAAMNQELGRRVAAAIADRETAETRVRRLRDELAQANRLSILGQIAAGVAHEINQPVAAIRTYAESGVQLLDAGATDEARGNLGAIVAVTERIGAITRMLRGFARRGSGGIGPVPVDEAIDGALALLSGRIRDAGARVDRGAPQPGLSVIAGRIRLEQILVNLLQNALDALRDSPDPAIAIAVAADDARVSIRVRDNGPGIAAEARETLFMPFVTTKPTGLGLGLVISGDIAREFGGSLQLDPESGPGASFVLELPRGAA